MKPLVEFNDNKLRMRYAPFNNVDAVKAMSQQQKDCVKKIGSGSVLTLRILVADELR